MTRRGPFWDAIEGRAELPGAAVTLGFELIAGELIDEQGIVVAGATATAHIRRSDPR